MSVTFDRDEHISSLRERTCYILQQCIRWVRAENKALSRRIAMHFLQSLWWDARRIFSEWSSSVAHSVEESNIKVIDFEKHHGMFSDIFMYFPKGSSQRIFFSSTFRGEKQQNKKAVLKELRYIFYNLLQSLEHVSQSILLKGSSPVAHAMKRQKKSIL